MISSISKALIHLATKVAPDPSHALLKKEFGLPQDKYLDQAYLKKVRQIAGKKGFKVQSLGDIGSDAELLLFQTSKVNPKAKHILVIAGLHGDEQAPMFGLLRYLERTPDEILKMVNLSIIPLFNPTGFRSDNRDNQWKEETNRHYGDDKKTSREGMIFKSHLPLIKDIAKHGLYTMHEDPDARSCYIYMYRAKRAEALAEIMLGIERMFFEQRTHQEKEVGILSKGVVWNIRDGSLEDWSQKQGIPFVVTTETPGKTSFQERVIANTLLLNAFVDFSL